MNLEIFNKDLIPVYTTDTGEKVVLGRELHEKLGIGQHYNDWFKRMTKYDFVKNSGYVSFSAPRADGGYGRPRKEHLLNLETAQEIARMQRTQTGSDIVQKLNELKDQEESDNSFKNSLTVFSTDLIPVYTTDTGMKVVLGRELHEKLGIKDNYTNWFKRMREYGKNEGFEEGKSYFEFFQNIGNRSDGRKGKPKQDHIITLRMAKHIASIQKTDIGYDIREKLFDLEEAVNEQKAIVLDSYMIEDPIKRAERWIEEKKIQIALEEENKRMLPKAESFDKFINSDGLFCFRDAAALLNIGEKLFIEWLLNKGFVYRKSDKKGTLTAYAEYKIKPNNPKSWFKTIDAESQYKAGKFFKQTVITPQGLEAFRKMLKEEGLI